MSYSQIYNIGFEIILKLGPAMKYLEFMVFFGDIMKYIICNILSLINQISQSKVVKICPWLKRNLWDKAFRLGAHHSLTKSYVTRKSLFDFNSGMPLCTDGILMFHGPFV